MRSKSTVALTDDYVKNAAHSGQTYQLRNRAGTSLRQEIVWDSEVPGLGLRLGARGRESHAWVFCYRFRGRQRVASLGAASKVKLETARSVARGYHENLARARGRGASNPISNTKKRSTLLKLAKKYEAHVRLYVKRTTLKAYLISLGHIVDAFGQFTADDLEARHVLPVFERWTETKGPYSANHSLQVLRKLLQHAESLGERDAGRPYPTERIRRNREKKRGRLITPEQMGSLLKALDVEVALRPEALDTVEAIRLMVFLGARRREITRLTVGEIDFGNRRVALRDSKTGAKTLPLNQQAEAILRRVVGRLPLRRPDERVFPPTHHEVDFAVQYTWKRVRERAGLPEPTRLHDLRHTFISTALLAQVPLATVSAAVAGGSRKVSQFGNRKLSHPERVGV